MPANLTSSGNASTMQVTQQGSTFHVTGLLDFTTPNPSKLPPNVVALLPDGYLRVAITLPEITAHNNDAVITGGNTATIMAKFGHKEVIDVTGGSPAPVTVLGILLWEGVGLVVLAAIALVFWWRRRSKRSGAPPPLAPLSFGGEPRTPNMPFADTYPPTVPSPYPGPPPPPPGI